MRYLLALLVLLSAVSRTEAQRITTTSEERRSLFTGSGSREFYYAPIQNYQDASMIYDLYVTAHSSTTVHIAIGKSTSQKFPIHAQEVLSFRIPVSWTISSSGTVEDKAIHIWSDNADLTVNAVSRAFATSDGLTLLPTTAWGSEYVLAAFASFPNSDALDAPSEFTIVAKEDNTQVTITPSTGLRQGNQVTAHYKAGSPFTVTLQKGQAVMYKASITNGEAEGHDVTGTVIKSDKPVGVVSGVQCANIPAETSYCDHICEMMLPVDRWGTKYYTAPFASRKGGDAFVVIAKENNTTITRTSMVGTRVHAVLNQYEYYFTHDIADASIWTGDKPFMLVQYLNGTDYPSQGENAGIGDPAMVVIPPISTYDRGILFQTPKPGIGGTVYSNYVNVLVSKDAVNSTRFDGKSLAGNASALPLGGDRMIYRISNITPGAHTIESDSAVGLYVYGYGSYDAYAWPAPIGGLISYAPSDTNAPIIAEMSEVCYSELVRVEDAAPGDAGLFGYRTDSLINASLTDIEFSGSKHEVLSYRFVVIDSAAPASGLILVADSSSNERVIRHTYQPRLPIVHTAALSIVVSEGADTVIPIIVSAPQSVALAGLCATVGGSPFFIESYPTSIPASQSDTIFLRVTSNSSTVTRDTLIIASECWSQRIPLLMAPTPIAILSLEDTVIDFGSFLLGQSRSATDAILNLGTEPFTIDSIVVIENKVDFRVVMNGMPNIVPFDGRSEFSIVFEPTTVGAKQGRVRVFTTAGTADVQLSGEVVLELAVERVDVEQTVSIYPNPASGTVALRSHDGRTGLELLGVAGITGVGVNAYQILASSDPAVLHLDVSKLASGSYFVLIRIGEQVFQKRFSVVR